MPTTAPDSLAVASPARLGAAPDHRPPTGNLAELTAWFETEFSEVDGASGDVLHTAAPHAGLDWLLAAEVCREVARRGSPELIAEDGPCVLLAIPIRSGEEDVHVAVGAFLSRSLANDDDRARVAALLGQSRDEAERWSRRQRPLEPVRLRRMAELACWHLASRRQVVELEAEVEQLSAHLGATFEEISLLYRLTQNLKLSGDDRELGRRALEWLAEVVPAEGLALLYRAGTEADVPAPDSPQEPLLLTHGKCEFDAARFEQLASHLQPGPTTRPAVVKRGLSDDARWRHLGLRDLVVVPVSEGEHLFGWLAAFNHDKGGEFGSAEASLLGSVATILGIHRGNIDLYRQQAELLTGVVRAMTSAIDAKDWYTRGHSDRVARVAVRLAQELGCDSETVNTIYFSGLLHDIGKIGINDEVLRKPGRLTEEEFEHIKTHVVIGHRILVDVRKLAPMLPVVLHHHEAWDGSGYPHGLKAERIPFLARIVAVADAYDAMASDRPYRAGMPDGKLDGIIRAGAGQQWDPQVVEAFFRARDDIRAISRRTAGKTDADVDPKS